MVHWPKSNLHFTLFQAENTSIEFRSRNFINYAKKSPHALRFHQVPSKVTIDSPDSTYIN